MSSADWAPRVLIVGAAGGVGLACAEAFAMRGAELLLADCDGTALTRAAERLGAFSRYCDAIGQSSVEVFAEELAAVVPGIEVLINAAGRGYVRTLAMTRVTHAMLPLLRRARGCRLVVNVASVGGFASRDGMFPYASSREAFERLADMLKEQTRGTGIDVINVTPNLLPGAVANALWSDRQFALRSVDERDTAARIVELAAAARPDWRHRPPSFGLRA